MLNCRIERPPALRGDDYMNVYPPVNYGPGRLCAINRSTARVEFQAESHPIAEGVGLGPKVSFLKAGAKAALNLETFEDVSTAIELAKAVLSSRRGRG